MEKNINIQIHDYDSNGFYRIIADYDTSMEECHELRKKACESVKPDWDKLPPKATHIVYYAELVDKQNRTWFAGIYMHGEAYDDKEFDRIFCQPNVGYVGAFHKREKSSLRAKEHLYKDCIIVEFPDGQLMATALDVDGDPIEKTCNSLEAAQKWIDNVEEINNESSFEISER